MLFLLLLGVIMFVSFPLREMLSTIFISAGVAKNMERAGKPYVYLCSSPSHRNR